jgi:predicted nucleic acid-binding protein
MKDKYFIDTNIFIYSFDKTNPTKMIKSQSIISQALEKNNGSISTQVIQEFANVAIKKFSNPMKSKDLRIYMNEVLFPLCSVFPNFELLEESVEIHERYKYSFYDSMIISAAIISGSNILLSEDLKDKQKIENINILNPF